MLLFYLVYLQISSSIFCSEIDIGDQISEINNVVKEGKIQDDWSKEKAIHKYSQPESEFYLYVKGLDLLGPTYEITDIHGEDQDKEINNLIYTKTELDEIKEGLIKDYRAFKITQECLEMEGGTIFSMSLTFTAVNCDPITIYWKKECGEVETPRKGFSIGLTKGKSEIVANGIVNQLYDWNSTDNILKIPAEITNTIFYIYNQEPINQTYFLPPLYVADQEVLTLRLSGSAANGGYLRDEILELSITYNCIVEDKNDEEILIIIKLPYFKSLEIKFFKTCGVLQKESGDFLKMLILAIVLLNIGILGKVLYNRYQQGRDIWDFEYTRRQVEGFCREIRSKFSRKNTYYQPSEKELPDMFDSENFDEKELKNIHTEYGTV